MLSNLNISSWSLPMITATSASTSRWISLIRSIAAWQAS